ncbi:DNA-binding MarR family transcriptional regulator [Kibdelosporangium banguiense]|uniref:DNA-binding MarR family transcriptional regulator n=1 Tax=Kibdelosporangium banguiense TaxID=1365924 RepID=A0ABS4TDG2_9PSEU|nr:MarR family transcriptional regulator [Kibdelosporangium banguiense]MBP2322014.1 DNA-binding MarR family transcriptional regulator [Kibdelosporangium banguiense]
MKPTADDYIGLLRQIRALMEIQHAATMRNWERSQLQPGAGKLLAELSYGGEARISDLAERRFVDTSVVSRQAAQLEKLGLIERRRAPGDARVALLRITPEGEKVLEQWRERQVEMLAAAVQDWDAADVAIASGYLDQLNNGLRAALSG